MGKSRLIALVIVVGLFVSLPVVAYAKHTGEATGKANLHPLPLYTFTADGVAGAVPGSLSGVKAKFTFVDDGETITMEGEAWGLDPEGTYVSLIYDNGSVPGGPFACEPTGPELLGKMLVGEGGFDFTWDVDADGHGTITGTDFLDEELFGSAPPFPAGEYVSLDEFDTISIRQLELGFAAVACGEVSTHPGQ